MTQYNVLFLADNTHPAQTVHDHITAITSSSQLAWHVVNPLVLKTIDRVDLSMYDAIGIHYSIKPYNYYYLSRTLQNKIAEFQGLKFQFLQDEYQKVNLVQDYLYTLGIDILFTLVSAPYLEKAYPDPRLKHLIKIPILTAYVLDYMKNIAHKAIGERPIDVSYRARRCEYWLGRLAYEKQMIADEWVKRSQGRGLNLDISLLESDRVYGQAWLNLLQNSKAVLGTESGASIWDFDGSIEKQTRQYLKKHKQASFEETASAVLNPFDYNILYNAISPRLFEAVATRTPMILFPGDYNQICIADRHYIPLEKDFSNFETVLLKLKDHDYLEELANTAYAELIESGHYSQGQFSAFIEKTLLHHIKPRSKHQSADNIQQQFNKTISQHAKLNYVRRFGAEWRFILSNFISLILDRRVPFGKKVMNLCSGFKRYVTYLLPRILGS